MNAKGILAFNALCQILLLLYSTLLGSDGALNDTKRLATWDEPHKFVKRGTECKPHGLQSVPSCWQNCCPSNMDQLRCHPQKDGCDKNFLNGFKKIVEGSACKPRPMLIDIISPSSEIQFLPNKVVVNRCDGICHAKLKCIPTQRENVTVKVQQLNFLYSDIQPECGEVQVEEHTKCNCQCTVIKEHCNKKQVYQPGDCNCLCTNEDEKRKCLYDGNTWDNEQCLCT